MRAALDLGKAVGSRRIHAGDELEIEQQIAAFRALLQQLLDMLVEPVGGAEEQVALKIETLNLAAMGQQHLLVVARAIQRRAKLGAVKAVLDRLDPRRAERKRRAADDHADQDARNEAPADDDDDDGDQREIFELRQPFARFDDPFVQLVGAQIEQQAAEYEFRHEAEKLRRDCEHQ